jgi:phosphoglucomutase
MKVEVIDPVTDYAELMESCSISTRCATCSSLGFRMRFDAMHAVTGPYAKEILENRLGARRRHGAQLHAAEDFGGHHPDPNLVHAKELYDEMMGPTRRISARRPTATATAT